MNKTVKPKFAKAFSPFLFLSFLLIFFTGYTFVYSQEDEHCRTCFNPDYQCQHLDRYPECQGCSRCSTPLPTEVEEPPENLEGKIINKALPGTLSVLTGTSFLRKLLRTGISLAFTVGTIIFFFMLLVGGVKWISGGSDKARLEGAQKQITHALVGLAILLLSFAIIGLIGYLFGIDLLKISLPTL